MAGAYQTGQHRYRTFPSQLVIYVKCMTSTIETQSSSWPSLWHCRIWCVVLYISFFLNIPLQQQAQIFIKLYLKRAVNAFRVSFPDVFLLGYNTSQNESYEKKLSNITWNSWETLLLIIISLYLRTKYNDSDSLKILKLQMTLSLRRKIRCQVERLTSFCSPSCRNIIEQETLTMAGIWKLV